MGVFDINFAGKELTPLERRAEQDPHLAQLHKILALKAGKARAAARLTDIRNARFWLNVWRGGLALLLYLYFWLTMVRSDPGFSLAAPGLIQNLTLQLLAFGFFWSLVEGIVNYCYRAVMGKDSAKKAIGDLADLVKKETQAVENAFGAARGVMTAQVGTGLKSAVRGRAEIAWLYTAAAPLLSTVDHIVQTPGKETPLENQTFKDARHNEALTRALFVGIVAGFFTGAFWAVTTFVPSSGGGGEPFRFTHEQTVAIAFITFFWGLPVALRMIFPRILDAAAPGEERLTQMKKAVAGARKISLKELSAHIEDANALLDSRIDDLASRAARFKNETGARETKPDADKEKDAAVKRASQPPKFEFAPKPFNADIPVETTRRKTRKGATGARALRPR